MQNPGEFQADLEKYYRIEFGGEPPTLKRRVKLWATHFGLHCVAAYRFGRFSRSLRRRHPLAIVLVLLYEPLIFLIKLFHHVDVFSADIGAGFYIGHAGTIYIGRTKVGANFSVTHNVTIGLGAARGSAGLPVLGDDVWVGAGSILYGDVSIGNGVTINGGTVLSRSLPDRCLAGGNPGRILLMNYDNASLFGGYFGGPAIDLPTGAPAAAQGTKPPAAATSADQKAFTAPASSPAPAPVPSVQTAMPATAVPVTAQSVTAFPVGASPMPAVTDQASAAVTVTPVVVTPAPATPDLETAAAPAAEPSPAATVTAATVTPISVAPIASAQEIPAEAA